MFRPARWFEPVAVELERRAGVEITARSNLVPINEGRWQIPGLTFQAKRWQVAILT